MTSIPKFDSEIYSEESYPVTESEYDEVTRLMAEEGYLEFSVELEQQLDEQKAWKGSKQFNEVLIKKACEHTTCPHTRCAKAQRIGGIEI
jgi:uncharacterized protein YozE (UPF0346 family)